MQLTEKLNQQLQTTQKELQSFMEEYKIRMKVSQLSLWLTLSRLADRLFLKT